MVNRSVEVNKEVKYLQDNVDEVTSSRSQFSMDPTIEAVGETEELEDSVKQVSSTNSLKLPILSAGEKFVCEEVAPVDKHSNRPDS